MNLSHSFSWTMSFATGAFSEILPKGKILKSAIKDFKGLIPDNFEDIYDF